MGERNLASYRDHNGQSSGRFSPLLPKPNPHADDVGFAHQIGLVSHLYGPHLFQIQLHTHVTPLMYTKSAVSR